MRRDDDKLNRPDAGFYRQSTIRNLSRVYNKLEYLEADVTAMLDMLYYSGNTAHSDTVATVKDGLKALQSKVDEAVKTLVTSVDEEWNDA